MADGDYGFDPETGDVDTDNEELIAVGGVQGFAAPAAVRADRIAVDGTTLRYTDRDAESLAAPAGGAPAFASIDGVKGSLTAVPGYYPAATLNPGVAVGSEASGIRKATAAEFDNPDAYVLSDGSGNDRYPVRAGSDAGDVAQPLTAAEVRALLEEAFKVMVRARAQIRQPLDSRSQATIALVDTRGVVLGLVRGPDAAVFGTDVALQKARTASFFSSPYAAGDLAAATTAGGTPNANVRDFVTRIANFVGDPAFLTGKYAVSVRGLGNLARPYFPDGQLNKPNGPLSRPIAQFSPFSTGLQSALIVQNLTAAPDAAKCTFLPSNRLANGLQIFAGGEPVYRGGVLVGGIGVSGDGIDQDDMIGFLGHRQRREPDLGRQCADRDPQRPDRHCRHQAALRQLPGRAVRRQFGPERLPGEMTPLVALLLLGAADADDPSPPTRAGCQGESATRRCRRARTRTTRAR